MLAFVIPVACTNLACTIAQSEEHADIAAACVPRVQICIIADLTALTECMLDATDVNGMVHTEEQVCNNKAHEKS